MRKIVSIAAHGGRDPGAVANGLREKDLALEIDRLYCDLMEKTYSDVKMYRARTTDVYIRLSERVTFCDRIRPDLIVEHHLNAGGGIGFESFTATGLPNTGTTRTYARALHRLIADVFKGNRSRDRGLKSGNYFVITNTKDPAWLPEYGFLDDPSLIDPNNLKRQAFINQIVETLVVATGEALGLTRKQPPQPKPKPEPTPVPTDLPLPIRFVPVNIFVNGIDTGVVLQGIFSDDMVTRIPVLDVKDMPEFTDLQVDPHGTHIDMRFTVPKKDLTYAIRVLRSLAGLE